MRFEIGLRGYILICVSIINWQGRKGKWKKQKIKVTSAILAVGKKFTVDVRYKIGHVQTYCTFPAN